MSNEFTRRAFLRAGAYGLAAVAAGCDAVTGARVDAGGLDGGSFPDLLPPTPSCEADTEDNIEGPFYVAGAPERTTLVEPNLPGTRLTVSGRVLRHAGCAPIAGALLDFWQADDAGAYDATGYRLRGVFVADASGLYRLDTILPGRYLNGPTYRPRHIHVKVRAPGVTTLTTQLYFAGDPYNATDAFIHDSLIMTPSTNDDGSLRASFDFVV